MDRVNRLHELELRAAPDVDIGVQTGRVATEPPLRHHRRRPPDIAAIGHAQRAGALLHEHLMRGDAPMNAEVMASGVDHAATRAHRLDGGLTGCLTVVFNPRERRSQRIADDKVPPGVETGAEPQRLRPEIHRRTGGTEVGIRAREPVGHPPLRKQDHEAARRVALIEPVAPVGHPDADRAGPP